MNKKIKFYLIPIAFLSALAVSLYANSLNHPFFFDDIPNIVENPYIRNLTDINFFLEGLTVHQRWFRALPNLSFALNYHVHQYNVFGYRLVNLILHLLSGILVYFIARHLFLSAFKEKKGAMDKPSTFEDNKFVLLPLLTALIFVAHPIQVTTVAYIVQRNEGMSALFYLLAFLLFTQGSFSREMNPVRNPKEKKNPGKTSLKRHPPINRSTEQDGMFSHSIKRWLYLTGTGLSFLGSVFSKEIGFTLPIMIVFYDFLFLCKTGEEIKKRLKIYLPLLLAVGIYVAFFLRGGLLYEFVRGSKGWRWTPWENLLTQFNVITQYMKLIFLPLPNWLNIDHDFKVSRSLLEYPTYLSALTILLLLGLALYSIRKNRLVSFSIFWFFIVLAPTSSLIPIWDMMVEYRLYLPLLSYSLLLSLGFYHLDRWLMFRFSRKYGKVFISGMAVCLLVFYSAATLYRIHVLRTEVSLWTDASKKSPNKVRPKMNLISAYHQAGLYDQAIGTAHEVLKLDPQNFDAYNKLGVSYTFKKDFEKAVESIKTSIEIRPDNPKALNNLGVVYLSIGKYDLSMEAFLRAIALHPRYAEAYNNLAKAMAMKGYLEDAIKQVNEAVRLDPLRPEYRFNLAKFNEEKGQIQGAIREYREAVRLNPNFFEARLNLGMLYSRIEFNREAIRELEKALDLAPRVGKIHFMLGVNYLKIKERERAIGNLEKALELAANENDKRELESILAKLRQTQR